MSTGQNSLRALHAYVHAAAPSPSQPARAVGMRTGPSAWSTPCVLVVESQDEVYGRLKSLLEDAGLSVERAETGWAVATKVDRFAPDLILINEKMPHESGWLISAKLRLRSNRQPVWLYAVQRSRYYAKLKDYLGVDEIIAYDGLPFRLLAQIRKRIGQWQGAAIDGASWSPACCALPSATAGR